MIRIARVPLPEDLESHLHALTKAVSAAEGQGWVKEARRVWRLESTRTRVRARLYDALGQMAPGLEQCMYCGEPGSTIDHFEPISCNPLRTFDWLNHLLACSPCNSVHKRDQFPVDPDGKPLLIDPTVEDPFDHLLLSLETGMYTALTPKGAATIEVCGLNERLLPEGRLHARSVVDICLRAWAVAHAQGSGPQASHYVALVQGQPFADVCQTMLRQARMPGAEIVFKDSPDMLRLLRLDDLRQELLA